MNENLPPHTRIVRRLRYQAIQAYGGKCACCGETNVLFLCLDHIVPRSKLPAKDPARGAVIAKALKQTNYNDPNIQVLCYNCNSAKRDSLSCPCQSGTIAFTVQEGLEQVAKRPYRKPKFTATQVAEIKSLYVDGFTQKQLGDKYGVHDSTISNILRGRGSYSQTN